MKLSGSVEIWAAGLLPALTFLPRKSPLPVLECAKLTSTPEGVTLEVTNLETGYLGPLGVESERPGSMLVPLKRFSDLVRTLAPDTSLTLETTTKQIRVQTPAGRWYLPVLPVSEFPQTPLAAEEATCLTINASAMACVLAMGGYAASTDSTRVILTNISLSTTDETLTIVSTNGIRLAHSTYTAETTLPRVNICLAAEASMLVARWLQSYANAPVTLAITPSFLVWTCAGVTVHTRLSQDCFPAWKALIPQYPDPEARIARDPLLTILQRGATQQANRQTDPTQLTLQDDVVIIGTHATNGELLGQETLACAYTGPVKHVRCRTGILIDALRQIPGTRASCILKIKDGRSPFLLHPDGDPSTFTLMIGLNTSQPATPVFRHGHSCLWPSAPS